MNFKVFRNLNKRSEVKEKKEDEHVNKRAKQNVFQAKNEVNTPLMAVLKMAEMIMKSSRSSGGSGGGN